MERRLVISKGARRRNRLGALFGHSVLVAVASSSILALLFIFYFIMRDAIPFFRIDGVKEFFTSTHWYPSRDQPEFGALAIFVGSGLVTLGASCVAVPLGMLAALCLSDILPFSVRQVAKPVIELLAAIPSVVFGFFALVVFAPLLQAHGGSVLAVGAWMVLAPLAIVGIAAASEAAGSRFGGGRGTAYRFGAAAHHGSGAWMASGNAARIPSPWFNFLEPVRTLTATIAGDMGEADQVTGSARFHVLFAMALCLLAFAFIMNLVSEYAMRRSRTRNG
jgi:ABC-type phosphate transport system permease subunit